MKKLNLPDLTANSARSYHFVMVPMALIADPLFEELSSTAKLLYALFLNRASLSAGNQDWFTDEDGRLYILYRTEDIMKILHIAKPTAVSTLKQLEEIGLIERKRRGQGKPTRIYVKDFSAVDFTYPNDDPDLGYDEETEDPYYYEKYYETSSGSSFELQEVKPVDHAANEVTPERKKSCPQGSVFGPGKVQKLNPIKNKYIKTERIKNNPSLLTSQLETGGKEGSPPFLQRIETEVRDQVEAEVLQERFGQEPVQEVVRLISDVLVAQGGQIPLGGVKVPVSAVQRRFRCLTADAVAGVLDRAHFLADARNPHAYLRSMLYNAPSSTDLPVLGWAQRNGYA